MLLVGFNLSAQQTNSIEGPGYSFYPNPVNKGQDVMIDLTLNHPQLIEINVLDILGNIVYKQEDFVEEHLSSLLLHTQKVEPGVYFLSIQLNEEQTIRKLIVR